MAMCSGAGADDDDAETFMKKEDHKVVVGTTCKKCDQQAVVALRVLDPLCKDCFLSYCSHKYRSTLGKHHQVKPGDRILVAYSGGPSSGAMIHMVQEALNEEGHKKLLFVPTIIHIEEGCILNESLDDRLKACDDIYNFVHTTGWPCYVTTLEKVLLDSFEKTDLCLRLSSTTNFTSLFKENLNDQFQKLLSSFKTITAKEEFVWRMKIKLLLEIAKLKGFNKVFLSSSATRLSVQLLAAIAQGRGGQIPHETGFIDARNEVPILRPLREFTSKEIAMYNHINKVWYISRPTLTTKMQSQASIMKLTETFVSGLQAEFSATVSTIFRTGDKLSSFLSKSSQNQLCPICESALDTVSPEPCSAVSCLHLSEAISNNQCNKDKEGNSSSRTVNCCSGSQAGNCCESKNCARLTKPLSLSDLQNSLCYSCFLFVKEMNDVALLPSPVIKAIRTEVERLKMKKEIEEFLLPDN